MAAAIGLDTAARSLRQLADAAGGRRTRERIERLIALAESRAPNGRELNMGEVVDALFPDHPRGVTRLRDFRSDLRALAAAQGIELACEVDGQKHAPPGERRCWFTGADDQVQRIERLSGDATASAPGAVAIEDALARRAVRVCIDGPPDGSGEDLARRLAQALSLDRQFEVVVSDTNPLAGESPAEIRDARLGSADLVVCLLSTAYLAAHTRAEVDAERVVVPVALEPLGAALDLRGFTGVFTLDGHSFRACRRKPEFVNALHEQIVARLHQPAERDARMVKWPELLVAGAAEDLVEARALETTLAREPWSSLIDATVEAQSRLPGIDAIVEAQRHLPGIDAMVEAQRHLPRIDATVEVQRYLHDWADDPHERSYLVIFGEYGMGKTTACQAFTRALLQRRRDGDRAARLPIYLDLRHLGDVKHREPTLTAMLDTLLRRVWQSGGVEAPASAAEVIDHVQRRRAIVIFDGLDEVLVHLTETQGQALLRELWKILPPKVFLDGSTRRGAGRVIFTCRTHFFRTLREQHTYFRGEEREVVGPDSYAALHLLPFTADQVRVYLELRRPDEDGIDRALELIRSVHNLSELVQRPFNLQLVAGQLGGLERRIAAGGQIDTAALYEELVASWLERDQGKHQLPPRHKIRLMEELAAAMWGAGRRTMPVDRLEDWLNGRLDADDELGRWFRLSRADPAVLAEDLRTATFIVRPGVDEFEFAHTSLLEYFLARHLARALTEGDTAAWALPMPSNETLDFLAEIIAAHDTEACLEGLRRLRKPYRERASELAFRYCVRAQGSGAPALALTGFSLEGARLRRLRLAGSESGSPLHLVDCALAGADLREARLDRVRLERCDLSGAQLSRAEAHDSTIDHVALDHADLTGFVARGCRLSDLDMRGARAHRTQWLCCRGERVLWPHADESHLFAGTRIDGQLAPGPERSRASLVSFTGHGGLVRSVAWSPDGSSLAGAGDEGVVWVWDCATGEELLRLAASGGLVGAVAWSPDGSRLAGAGIDGVVRVWDFSTCTPLLHLADEGGWMAGVGWSPSVMWSPDGARLASGGLDGVVRVWSCSNGEMGLRLVHHDAWVNCVAWSPDGSRLASGGRDGGIWVWDCSTGEGLLRLTHGNDVKSVVWSPDGSRLASGGNDGMVWVWDSLTGERLLRQARGRGWIRSLSWSPDGLCVAGGGDDGAVLWDSATGERLLRHAPRRGWMHSLSWSPDGLCVAGGGDDGAALWDSSTGKELLRLADRNVDVLSVAWSPDGSRLASGGDDEMVRVWDSSTGDELLRLADSNVDVLSVAWSPDGARLASGSDDGVVRVWDSSTGEGQLCVVDGYSVNCVVWSPDGSRLASGSNSRMVCVWDSSTGEVLLRLTGHDGWVKRVVWSPDGSRLASAGDLMVRVWDSSTGDELLCLAHRHSVNCVVWSPDGSRLASGSDDGVVWVWDCSTGEVLLRLADEGGWIRNVTWSSDGSRLASANADGMVSVWDCSTGERLLRLDEHHGSVADVAWSPDGLRLASAGTDGTVRVWDPATRRAELVVHIFGQDERAVEVNGRLTSCSPEAWRWLGWLAPSPITGQLTRYPAETFGPLPVT
ncbi:MAG TPA: NACHT domain-containing protein [Solirubrobacteraceae bacterium]|jgi:WD40 repeat protein|nr:NACHT domain-containing protein [Solirubrobacteraceae bacterium]